MESKAQSALEFMMAYSWAFIIISLFVVSVLLISDSRPPSVYLGSSCNIQPLLPCSESLLTYNSINPSGPLAYYVVFTNDLGAVMFFPQNSLNLTTYTLGSGVSKYTLGNCAPAFAGKGATVLCAASISGATPPKVGTQEILTFSLNYNLCSAGTKGSCGIGIYKSSGFSTESVAPSSINLYNLTFGVKPTSAEGTIVLNEVTYFNGTSTYLYPGNYIISADPQQGYTFVSWSVNSPSSVASPTGTTTLTVNANAVLVATFMKSP